MAGGGGKETCLSGKLPDSQLPPLCLVKDPPKKSSKFAMDLGFNTQISLSKHT